jgi:hypothetical protein
MSRDQAGIDPDTGRAIDELAYKIRDRGDADVEVVAREFILRLRALGWRPTEAKPAPPWKIPPGDSPDPDPDRPGGVEYIAVREKIGRSPDEQ